MKTFFFALILPALIVAQGNPSTKQEEVTSAMLGFERQIRRFYQAQLRNMESTAAKRNLSKQPLIPCSKIEEASKNLQNNVESVVQVENVVNWITSLEECLVSVLSKITSLNSANVADRIKVVEHTLGRYGIITIGPRFGGQTEELLGRIVRLERQLFNNKEDNVNHNEADDQLRQRLEQQEKEIKELKAMISKGNARIVDTTTDRPIPTVSDSLSPPLYNASLKPGPSTLTINELVDKLKKRSALHLAAKEGDMPRLRNLLQNGANTDLQDFKMWTPLHLASWKGHTDAILLLLDYGANIEARDQFNYTALHWAAQNGNVASVKALLQRGANMEAKDNNDETPLHKAAWEGKAMAMETLLYRGANSNALRKEGYTPLHLAILQGCVQCVKSLINAGVDVSIRTEEGEDAMRLARDNNNLDIIKILEKAKATLDLFGRK